MREREETDMCPWLNAHIRHRGLFKGPGTDAWRLPTRRSTDMACQLKEKATNALWMPLYFPNLERLQEIDHNKDTPVP